MDRLVSLSVGVEDVEDYVRTFQHISELAMNLGENHTYVSVSASVVGEPDGEPEEAPSENLHYDEDTLVKVRQALTEAAGPYGHGEHYVDDLIHAMQNAGILFRERPKNEGR